MGNCIIRKTKKVTNGITYYEFPSYVNKNVQKTFSALSSKYPNHVILTIDNSNVIPNIKAKKSIYISYCIENQLVTQVVYFP